MLEFYRNNTLEILLAHHILIFGLTIAIAILWAKNRNNKKLIDKLNDG